MPNIVLKTEDQSGTIYTFTKAWLSDETPNPRVVEYQVGGRTGGIIHFTGSDNSEFIMRALIESDTDAKTLTDEVLAQNVRYLDASAYNNNLSGKVYIVELSSQKVRGTAQNHIITIIFRRYNN